VPRRFVQAAGLAALLLCGATGGGAQQTLVVGDFSPTPDASKASAPGDAGIPAPWKLVTRAGKADFSLERDGGIAALVMKSHKASFGFQRETSVNVDDYPTLRWKWKASRLPEGGDFRQGRTDDQAAQLYVAFSKTRAIAYIWDSGAPEGTVGDAAGLPPFVSIKVVVVRGGAGLAGRWIEEKRNLRDDYERLFGPAPAPLVARGVQVRINSQHTQTEAEGAFADIAFERAGK
jgi:hypothetical protein